MRKQYPDRGPRGGAGAAAAAALTLMPVTSVATARPLGTRLPRTTTAGDGSSAVLNGVIADSANSAWAVGTHTSATGASKTLVMHWDGTNWQAQHSASPGKTSNTLWNVTNRWAVGTYTAHKVTRSLVLRRSGSAWKHVKSPNPGGRGGTFLSGVSGNWAVGGYWIPSSTGVGRHALILHWNGVRWRRVPCPNPGSDYTFVYAVHGRSAVGSYANTRGHTLVLAYRHHRWRRVHSASPGRNGDVARAVSGRWAVGVKRVTQNALNRTLILHRSASGWRRRRARTPVVRARSGATTSSQVCQVVGRSATTPTRASRAGPWSCTGSMAGGGP